MQGVQVRPDHDRQDRARHQKRRLGVQLEQGARIKLRLGVAARCCGQDNAEYDDDRGGCLRSSQLLRKQAGRHEAVQRDRHTRQGGQQRLRSKGQRQEIKGQGHQNHHDARDHPWDAKQDPNELARLFVLGQSIVDVVRPLLLDGSESSDEAGDD